MTDTRSRPQLTRLLSEKDGRSATLVSGWIRDEALAGFLAGLGEALGEGLPRDEATRIAAALPSVPDEEELEWTLGFREPVLAHFVADQRLIAVDVLLEGRRERSVQVVREAFAAFTVDPRAA